jgi:CRISPR-associated endonuclease/helicase Cas3
MAFEELVRRAAGHGPYPYQRRVAEQGLPDVLAVPTGAGKTLAATLPWLYRRRFHSDGEVRARTPRWLVFTLPMRVLVEQTYTTIEGWLAELGLTGEVGLYRVMGGESRTDSAWRYRPEQDAIFVGTIDMLLSRALNRGYGESRWSWPIDFGLFNTGTQWVFDEVQLMGPALPTSRQLDGLRRVLGTAAGCRSMWMSATVARDRLVTVDNPDVDGVVELSPEDRTGPLQRRLDAAKTIGELTIPSGKDYVRDLASAVVARHREGKRTIVVVNTVDRATDLHHTLTRQVGGPPCVLVHSRFRPGDRQRAVDAALARVDPDGPGLVVVSTQVLEAGVDISATTLITELAPWPSIVQRAGRCNREGTDEGASLWWVRPPKALPYDDVDLDAAAHALADLEGCSGSPSRLLDIEVPAKPPLHPVLRRRDLLDLFDTLPDLSGNDVDVARFIRSDDGVDAYVAWRDLDGRPPDAGEALPAREERCPVPLSALRDRPAWVDQRHVWRYDHMAERWLPCGRDDVRAGQVLIVDAGDGGYEPERGWSPAAKARVEPVVPSPGRSSLTEEDTAVGADPATFTATRQWVSLARHLDDVETEVRRLVEDPPLDLPPGLLEAAATAGRYHDVGKAHEVFQETLAASAVTDDEHAAKDREPQPWAKSGGSRRPPHRRPHFRHELASALALLSPGNTVLRGSSEPDLVVYLVAAHHGRVRLGFRSLPGEKPPEGDPDRLFALGVWDDDPLPAVTLDDEEVPASRLDLSTMLLGRSADGTPSWAERALALRDRDDLGPFRLGFLEALVRVADWSVSADYDNAAERS